MDLNIGIYALAAIFVEGVVTYFLTPFLKSKYLIWGALLVSVLFCFGYRLDLLREVFGLTAFWPPIGYVVTALVISRGSNFVNDFISLTHPLKKS